MTANQVILAGHFFMNYSPSLLSVWNHNQWLLYVLVFSMFVPPVLSEVLKKSETKIPAILQKVGGYFFLAGFWYIFYLIVNAGYQAENQIHGSALIFVAHRIVHFIEHFKALYIGAVILYLMVQGMEWFFVFFKKQQWKDFSTTAGVFLMFLLFIVSVAVPGSEAAIQYQQKETQWIRTVADPYIQHLPVQQKIIQSVYVEGRDSNNYKLWDVIVKYTNKNKTNNYQGTATLSTGFHSKGTISFIHLSKSLNTIHAGDYNVHVVLPSHYHF